MYAHFLRQDELNPAKLELLCAAVRQEIEAETIEYLTSEQEIEYLAQAVETGRKSFVDEVGLYSSEGEKALAQRIPQGSRLMISLSTGATRLDVAELVRSMEPGQPIRLKKRPMTTSRTPSLDGFSKALMGNKTLQEFLEKLTHEEVRDKLLLALWDRRYEIEGAD